MHWPTYAVSAPSGSTRGHKLWAGSTHSQPCRISVLGLGLQFVPVAHVCGCCALQVNGDGVYSKLKWEAGVHRVQRVPATEAAGRVHTSTATVAIMPEVDEVDVQLDMREIDVKFARWVESPGCVYAGGGDSWMGIAVGRYVDVQLDLRQIDVKFARSRA